MKRNRKHDNYVRELEDKVSHNYGSMSLFYEYSRGEIDLIGRYPGGIDIYEVKCNNGRSRAIEQLHRAHRRLYKGHKNVRLFYYCGREDRLEEI